MKKQKKCDTSKGEVFKEMRLLVTDRLDAPPIEVSDLINQVEGAVSEGLAIPLVAFVSGSGINRQIEFMNYDPNHHKLVLPEFFMQLIRSYGWLWWLFCGDNWFKFLWRKSSKNGR